MSWAMRCLLDALETGAILAGMVIVPWYIGKAGVWLIRRWCHAERTNL